MATSVLGKEEEIGRLLSDGAAPADLVRQGYARGTVYKVAGRLRTEATPQNSDETAQRDFDPGVENDPEIVELKKAVRRAELELQIEEIKGSSSIEVRLLALERSIQDVGTFMEEGDDSPLSGLREGFQCSCGAEGLVAVRVICTCCKNETSYGWWPKSA